MRCCSRPGVLFLVWLNKFWPDYGLLLELHALTLAACSYALLMYLLFCVFLCVRRSGVCVESGLGGGLSASMSVCREVREVWGTTPLAQESMVAGTGSVCV